MPTKTNLRPVRDKLSAGSITYDDGVTKISLTNNVNNHLGIQLQQRGYDDKVKTITTYQSLDILNKMLKSLGYEIVQRDIKAKIIDKKTKPKTKKEAKACTK